MNASVNGILTFGLVSVPVGVASAVKSTNDPTFRTLHQVCKQPVVMKTVDNAVKAPASPASSSQVRCETCNVVVEAGDTVKGYEYAKDEFVYFTAEEIEALKAERTPRIELTKFVKATSIKPVMIEKSYFLIPNKMVEDRYALLYQALADLKVTGIGMQSLWGKEHPCAVSAVRDYESGGVLMLQTLVIAEDLTQPDFAAAIPKAEAKKIAKQVITSMTEELVPSEDLVSGTRNRIFEAISAKIEGREVSRIEGTETEEIPDIIEALRKSVASKPKTKKEQVK